MNGAASSRMVFIINGRSGGQVTVQILERLRLYASRSGGAVEVHELMSPGALNRTGELVREDTLVIGGGDGTFSTLLPVLAKCRCKIGILPLGTGNDLARELGLARLVGCADAEKIVRFFRSASYREVSYFDLEFGEGSPAKRSFINYVSFGFDAKVVQEFADLRSARWWRPLRSVWGNRLGYAGLSLKNLGHGIDSAGGFMIRSSLGEQVFSRVKSVIFANIRSIMGLGRSNLHSSIFDSQVECVVTTQVVNYLAMLTHLRAPKVIHPQVLGSAAEWEIVNLPPGTFVQVDGEPGADIKARDFKIRVGGRLLMASAADN